MSLKHCLVVPYCNITYFRLKFGCIELSQILLFCSKVRRLRRRHFHCSLLAKRTQKWECSSQCSCSPNKATKSAKKLAQTLPNIDHFRAEKLCLSAILTFSNFQKVRYFLQITTYGHGLPSVVRYLGLCPLFRTSTVPIWDRLCTVLFNDEFFYRDKHLRISYSTICQ